MIQADLDMAFESLDASHILDHRWACHLDPSLQIESPRKLDQLCDAEGNKPVPIPSNVEHHIAVAIVGISEPAAHYQKIVPPDSFDYAYPRFDFARRIRVLFDCFAQTTTRDDMHSFIALYGS